MEDRAGGTMKQTDLSYGSYTISESRVAVKLLYPSNAERIKPGKGKCYILTCL